MRIEADEQNGTVNVTGWVPTGGFQTTFTQTLAPTGTVLLQQPGVLGSFLVGVGPPTFSLPVSGGTQQLSGSVATWATNTGALTLTPQG